MYICPFDRLKFTVKLHAKVSEVLGLSRMGASTSKLRNVHIPVSPVDPLSAPGLNRAIAIVEEVIWQRSLRVFVCIFVASNPFKGDPRATGIHCNKE